jgi:hypothetical protein
MTQWLNATLGGNPDQPFSARCAIEAEKGGRGWVITEAFVNLVFALLKGERDHCRRSLAGPNS